MELSSASPCLQKLPLPRISQPCLPFSRKRKSYFYSKDKKSLAEAGGSPYASPSLRRVGRAVEKRLGEAEQGNEEQVCGGGNGLLARRRGSRGCGQFAYVFHALQVCRKSLSKAQ